MKLTYNNILYSIGEFQIHNNRDGVKFRFNRNNFHTLIEVLIKKEVENNIIIVDDNISLNNNISLNDKKIII